MLEGCEEGATDVARAAGDEDVAGHVLNQVVPFFECLL